MTRRPACLAFPLLALLACSGGGDGGSTGNAGGGAGGGGGGGGGTIGAAFNADITIPQAGPQLARDASGRMHVLSASSVPNAQGQSVVRYGECASNCGSSAGWSFVTLDTGAAYDGAVKLAVEPGGRVHVLELLAGSFVYATCTSGCTSLAAWTAAQVSFPVGFSGLSLPVGRSFAASAAGKPRALLNAYGGAGAQVFLLGCDGTCSDGTGWHVDPLVNGKATAAAMTPGEPHQAVLALELGFHLVFAECASQCGSVAQWTQADLTTANANFVALVRGPAGELHAAWNSSLAVAADQTLYGRCSAQCGQLASWTFAEADRGGRGRGGLDLAIGSNGALAIAEADAVNDAQVLRWATCSSGCTLSAGWTSSQLESGAAVTDPVSTLPGTACNTPFVFWAVGGEVQLVPAAASGAFQLAYDATNYDKCLGMTFNPSQIRAGTVRLATRSP